MGNPSQQGLAGVRSKAQTQAEYVVELKDKASKTKDQYDEGVEELLGLMREEGIETVRVDEVTFCRVESEKVKIEGYKKPVVGE